MTKCLSAEPEDSSMLRASQDVSQFKVISGATFYTGREGAESEAGRLHVGSVLQAAVANENRTLDGLRVPVVLFKIGSDGRGWYWLPRGDFYRCTEKFNPGPTTIVPFPLSF
jgi:hypothetical protein